MRLPNEEHEAGPWRIREIAPDFTLEDVWALPVQGEMRDFDALLDVVASAGLSDSDSRLARALWVARIQLGKWFGWDKETNELPMPGGRTASLTDRLPPDLRDTASGMTIGTSAFVPLYRTDTEAAAELSNKTVHGVLHLGWVAQDDGTYAGQLAIYVKPRGRRGRVYMAAIKPFRHLIVYPALLRQIERSWNNRDQKR